MTTLKPQKHAFKTLTGGEQVSRLGLRDSACVTVLRILKYGLTIFTFYSFSIDEGLVPTIPLVFDLTTPTHYLQYVPRDNLFRS